VLLSTGIILPFFITSPQKFIYNVFLFQFERSFQSSGIFSLYGLVNETVGLSLSTWLRVAIFIAGVIIAMVWLRRKLSLFTPLLGGLLLFGAFILPVNGFLNYFLPGAAVVCALIPYAIDKIAIYLEKSTSQ
jgi:hypothetical protein